MIDSKRIKRLEEALEELYSASKEEKEIIFKGLISELEEAKKRFERPDNRFDSYEQAAISAMDDLRIFTRRLIGYNTGWVPEKFLKYCGKSAGRSVKYDGDTRLINCYFISLMIERGSSETQAMKLLMRLLGDSAMTSGHLRELQDTYRDYKAAYSNDEMNIDIDKNGWVIAKFLSFSIENLEGEEVASKNAVKAFHQLWQEVINIMKEYHSIIAERDSGYPELFGCCVDWVNSEFENPLDYFYKHKSHKTHALHERQAYLREYLNTVGFFMDLKAA